MRKFNPLPVDGCGPARAVCWLTKAMALELVTHGIRVLSIAPTFVEAPMYRQMAAARLEFAQWVRDRIPAGRLGQPEDVPARQSSPPHPRLRS